MYSKVLLTVRFNSKGKSINTTEFCIFQLGYIHHCWKSSISIFQEIFASTDKIFILGVEVSARQLFYEVLSFAWYFLIFQHPELSLKPFSSF